MYLSDYIDQADIDIDIFVEENHNNIIELFETGSVEIEIEGVKLLIAIVTTEVT